jgi:hypothetical protein
MITDYNLHRAWYEQWYRVRDQLAALEAASKPDSYSGQSSIKEAFEIFFTQCIHVGDWLWGDKTTGLSIEQVRSFINNDPNLRLCAGMANTSKHHTRNRPGAMTAKIATISTDTKGTHVVIGWSEGRNNGTADALDLARRCVDAWKAYLAIRNLRSPL